jgi:hypothetical protein
VNTRIRANTDETNPTLVGWGECLDKDSGVFYNNIKVRIKKGENGRFKLLLDFPSKIAIMQDKTEKKIFYVKPVTSAAYKAFESAFVHCIVEARRSNAESKL